MSKRKLGLYFGAKDISLVEVQGTHIITSVRVPLDRSESESSGAGGIPEEIKYVAAMQGALRDNKIEAKKVFAGFSSKDEFIRGFQMLPLPRGELEAGVQFEARKHIPFKTEDMVFDYQQYTDKKTAKMNVLFVAVTKDNFETNISILNQLEFQIGGIEPASLAVLRILNLTKQLVPKTSFALVAIEDEEAEFTVVNNGFPCFNRDIKLSGAAPDIQKDEAASLRARLVSEIRVSLDYYRRQFSGGAVDKILFLSKQTQAELISELSSELNLPVEAVDLKKVKELDALDSLNMLKAYSLVLSEDIKIKLLVNLAKKKHIQTVGQTKEEQAREEKPVVFNMRMVKLAITLTILMALFAYGYPQIKLFQGKTRFDQLRDDAESALLPKLKGLPLDALRQKKTEYFTKLSVIDKLINTKLYLTPSWNILPQTIPAQGGGLWLENLDIALRDDYQSIRIKGAVYLDDQNAELNAVNGFFRKLKNNADFMQGLVNLDLSSVSQVQVGDLKVTRFEITGS